MDLIPPQLVMRNNNDGHFKMNGHQAILEFKGGVTVNVPYNAVTRLPILVTFDDIDQAAQHLETS